MAQFDITLPSRGLLYGDKLPGGKVTLKGMTATEQSILFSQGGNPQSKFNQVINNCLVDLPMDPMDLLVTDRMYIFMILRTRAVGADYEFPMRCSSCNTQFRHKTNILQDIEERVMEEGSVEPFEVKLPVSGDVVSFRLLRGKDEAAISKQSKRLLLQSVDNSDPSFYLRLATMIQKVNEVELDTRDKLQYVRELEYADTMAIQDMAEDSESGLDLIIYYECSNCGHDGEGGLPFTAEFFRPDKRKSKRSR